MKLRITKRRSRNKFHTVTLRLDENTASMILMYAIRGAEAFLEERDHSPVTTEVTEALIDTLERAEALINDPIARAYGAEEEL